MTGLTALDEVDPNTYNTILPVPMPRGGYLVPWLEDNIRALNEKIEALGRPAPVWAGQLQALAAVYRVATCMGEHDNYLDSDCRLCGWTWSDEPKEGE